MNILFLDQFSDPGGAQFCLRDLMLEVQRRGWSPRLMVPGSGELVKWSSSAGIPVYPLPLRPYSNGSKTALDFLRFSIDGPRAAAAIRRVVQRERVDLIYVNGPRVLPAVFGISCPIVFHVHTHVRVLYARKLLEWTLRTANTPVIAVSQYIADGYLPVLGHQRVRVIYSGIPDFQGRTRGFRERPVRVGIIGRIAPDKGQLDFVRAAIQIAQNGGGVEFFVYGERMFADAEYNAEVRKVAANAPVKFCGWTNDVGKALHGLDIVAVPSVRDDPAPRVVMEALSAGTPVVAYRSGGIPELVEDGRTGVLTDTRDSSSLARSIQFLMRDPGLMERLSAAGRSEWQLRFRVERYRTDICDLLETWAPTTISMRRG